MPYGKISYKKKRLLRQSCRNVQMNCLILYNQTQEGNGQRGLMTDLEDKDDLYHDILRLIKIHRSC